MVYVSWFEFRMIEHSASGPNCVCKDYSTTSEQANAYHRISHEPIPRTSDTDLVLIRCFDRGQESCCERPSLLSEKGQRAVQLYAVSQYETSDSRGMKGCPGASGSEAFELGMQ